MKSLKDFYQGKQIFLTGATGFKGSWLCLLLHSLGAKIYDYSLAPPSSPSLWELLSIEKICTHKRANILDRAKLKKCLQDVQPDIVIHLAAQALVRSSYVEPYTTLETNIMGTASVLDAVLSCDSARSTLIITSDKAYENIGKQYPYVEGDRMGGDDPYSASKGAAELISNAYRKSFFNTKNKGLATVRAGNVIGGGDFATDRLVPDMARAFKKNESVTIRYPKATRPWQHVLDPLYGYLLLAKALYQNPQEYSEGWNFGPLHNEAHSVEEVVKRFTEQWNKNTPESNIKRFTITTQKQPHEAAFLGLDCQKAGSRLQWTPKLNFEESIDWTAVWYKEWSVGTVDLNSICMQQIIDFLRR